MPATQPEEVNRLLAEAFNSGDVDAATALYEPGGVFVAQPGQIAIGPDVRDAVAAFIALKPNIQLEVTKMIQAGEIALLCSQWTLKGTAPDGSAIEMAGKGTEVVRQQPDGTWLYVIDNPYGVD